MADSDSSSLSSAPASSDEKLAPIFLNAKGKGPKKRTLVPLITVPPPRNRTPSPELPETLADNPDIAFIVMFRNRFSEAFPAKMAHLGPQDLERGVTESTPSPHIEDLLCALLGIVLNRKKPVERGHYGRALEEAITSQRSQWPKTWNDVNPISGSKGFNTMTPAQRLDLLRHLIIWALSTSEMVSNIIKESYKQTRHDDDQNQPLSVQPWGKDSDKRAFYLIEGQDDTSFRVYREANRTLSPVWRSVAGSIDEIKELATKLEKDPSISARQLAKSIQRTIPRFEATEEKRRRREYRQQQRSRFTRPEPGFSLYEGRTRGKRMRYTFDDDDDDDDDGAHELGSGGGSRRSDRHVDRTAPMEPSGPVFTASGRQVKQRGGGPFYRETGGQASADMNDVDMEDADPSGTRASRSNGRRGRNTDGGRSMSDRESESDGGWNSEENENENENENEDHDADESDGDDDQGSDGDSASPRSTVMVVIKLPRDRMEKQTTDTMTDGVDETRHAGERADSELGTNQAAVDEDIRRHAGQRSSDANSKTTSPGVSAPPTAQPPHADERRDEPEGGAQSAVEGRSGSETTAGRAGDAHPQIARGRAGDANENSESEPMRAKVEGMSGSVHQRSVAV